MRLDAGLDSMEDGYVTEAEQVDQETEKRTDHRSNRRGETHEQHSVFKFRHSVHLR